MKVSNKVETVLNHAFETDDHLNSYQAIKKEARKAITELLKDFPAFNHSESGNAWYTARVYIETGAGANGMPVALNWKGYAFAECRQAGKSVTAYAKIKRDFQVQEPCVLKWEKGAIDSI